MRVELLERDRVQSIIGAFFEVYNCFGPGLSESVYAGALEIELSDRGHDVLREVAVEVRYKGRHIGWQRLDKLVDRRIIIENKATERLATSDHARLINYLKITPFEVALLLHFGPSPKFYKYIDTPKRSIRADSCASVRIRDQSRSKRRGGRVSAHDVDSHAIQNERDDHGNDNMHTDAHG